MRKLDTAELGPVSVDTAPRVLRIREIVMGASRGQPIVAAARDYDVVEWQGIRFRKEVE